MALHLVPVHYSRCGGNAEEKNKNDKKARPAHPLIKGIGTGQSREDRDGQERQSLDMQNAAADVTVLPACADRTSDMTDQK